MVLRWNRLAPLCLQLSLWTRNTTSSFTRHATTITTTTATTRAINKREVRYRTNILNNKICPRHFTTAINSVPTASSAPLSSSGSEPIVPSPPMRERKKRHVRTAFVVLAGSLAVAVVFNLQDENQRSWQLGVLKSLPLNLLSRVWGSVNRLTVPLSMRAPLYHLWTYLFGCNLDEAALPLEEYHNLSEFFARTLKPGVRPIYHADVISPVDGRVTVIGTVDADGRVEQIKGMSYALGEFLGFIPDVLSSSAASSITSPAISSSVNIMTPSPLHYIVFYLAPGDYHRIHNPVSCLYHHRRHFPGHLFPVNPFLLSYVPNLFIRNERVVLAGRWRSESEHSMSDADRFFAMIMVGAYNVGSVKLSYDESLVTNQRRRYNRGLRAREWWNQRWRQQRPEMDTTDEALEGQHAEQDIAAGYIKLYGKAHIQGGEVKPVKEPLLAGDTRGVTAMSPNQAALDVESRTDVKGLRVSQGEEVARFELGSTVVLVFQTNKDELWQWEVKEGDTVKMGQAVGRIIKSSSSQ